MPISSMLSFSHFSCRLVLQSAMQSDPKCNVPYHYHLIWDSTYHKGIQKVANTEPYLFSESGKYGKHELLDNSNHRSNVLSMLSTKAMFLI